MGLLVACQSEKGNSGKPNAPFFRKLRFFPGDALRVQLAWGSAGRLFFFGWQVCLFFAGRASFFGLGIGVGFGFGVAFGFFGRLTRFVGVEGAFLFSGVNLSRARIPLR